MSKLSLHWIPQHTSDQDLQAIARWQPPVVKIVDGDANRWRQAYSACPNALFVYRDWALSEEKDAVLAHPTQTGTEHAERLAAAMQSVAGYIPAERIIGLGINEPPVWDQGGVEVYNAYTIALLEGLRAHGRRGGAWNLSVGWPANTGTDTPVDWQPYAPTLPVIIRGNHVLVLHEYWSKAGPTQNWTWWAGRTLQCPWPVPIIIGECGLDRFVEGGDSNPDGRGWQTNVSGDTYMEQLAWYDQRMMEDPRIIGGTIFTYDFNPPWGTFDLRPLREKVADWAVSHPTPVEPPVVPPVPPEQTLTENLIIAAEANDVLAVNPDAALAKQGLREGLWPTSNEFPLRHGGVDYVAQRFRDPGSNDVYVLYCVKDQWATVMQIVY